MSSEYDHTKKDMMIEITDLDIRNLNDKINRQNSSTVEEYGLRARPKKNLRKSLV